MAMSVEEAVRQLTDELAQARAQIVRITGEMATIRTQAAQAIADSEARLSAAIASSNGNQKDEDFKMVDFKVNKPADFYGRREESWKSWSRQFKTYCNAIKPGFRKALEWSEAYTGEAINTHSIDEMGWPTARLADERLYDFLVLTCKQDALIIVETYEGLGFEAWRQLHKRFSPSGGQYELDMFARLMNPQQCTRIEQLPGAILRFERDIRTYELRTGRSFPAESKTQTFLCILHNSHKDELVWRYQMGTRDYETLVSSVRGFSQEAWFSQKGPSDMDVDNVDGEHWANLGNGKGHGGTGGNDYPKKRVFRRVHVLGRASSGGDGGRRRLHGQRKRQGERKRIWRRRERRKSDRHSTHTATQDSSHNRKQDDADGAKKEVIW